MTVIANDFIAVHPYTTKVVTLSPGQRSDVLVTAKAGRSDSKYWIRSNISTICSDTKKPEALAGKLIPWKIYVIELANESFEVAYYDRADTNSIPHSTPWDIPDPGNCRNDPYTETVPLYSMTPTSNPGKTVTLVMDAGLNSGSKLVWYFNQSTYLPNVDDPLLLLANEANMCASTTYFCSCKLANASITSSYPENPQWNVYDMGESTSVRIIVINKTPAHHPMHLHGHNMFVLADGIGTWDGTVVNPANPQRRDTVQLVSCVATKTGICLEQSFLGKPHLSLL